MLTLAAGRVRQASAVGLRRLARPRVWPSPRVALHPRWLADVADAPHLETVIEAKDTLAIQSQARRNEIGVQQLSSHIFGQIFPQGKVDPPKELVELAIDHLKRHDLHGKTTDTSEPIAFDLPPLQGQTLDEHFYKLGVDCARPHLTLAKEFMLAELPPKPLTWKQQPGWTKYWYDKEQGLRSKAVDAPDAKALCFDVEVMWKESPFAVMACAASSEAWYAWLSPWLLGKSESNRHLIPMGDPTQDRIIVGHNVGYDRARILEEYSLKQTRNGFLDTMSLHVAVNGMCSQQRPTWMRFKKNRELRERVASETPDVQLAEMLSNKKLHEEEDMWVERSSINSLRDVAKFHLNMPIDKELRNHFGELDRQGVLDELDQLLTYCATDVSTTHRVYKCVFPHFLEVCPHPVSFAALRHLSSVFLPIDESWKSYIANAEATYHKLSDSIKERLSGLAEKALELKDDPEQWKNDPWMQQLDWSGQEIKMVKGKRKGDPPRPSTRQKKKPGMPQWYRDLFPKCDSPINISVRTRIAPLLLRLAWDSYPMFWSNQYGWTFRVPREESNQYEERQLPACVFDETDNALKLDSNHVYYKVPHKDGPTARCASPMAKGYLSYFENGTLSSEYPLAKEALEMNASCSYWISARDRIMSQMAVYESDLPQTAKTQSGNGNTAAGEPASKVKGFILPQVIPMGTITRRAVENTWLTASNAKENRVGSELKAMVKAPEGYSFVGADVDSEELWIASLMGDATFQIHGGNAIGFMTLEGTKAAGTDLHSRTADILGISRNNAKVFNYGRIYGAGLRFAATLLRQFNPSLSEKETMEVASRLYANTKGSKTTRKWISKRPFWRGGTESFVFNKLEEFAEHAKPRTPVLGAHITEALRSSYISGSAFLTSRINWAIQSSGVDYLHLLIVSMDYLIRRFNIEARLAITVHDEIRYLVKNEDKYRAALALQISNLWTRAMFAQQVGINDLPQSCAFFSAVDIDHVLRKEVDMDCVTPSHPTPISPGESLDIQTLLDRGNEARLDPGIQPNPRYAPYLDDPGMKFEKRTPVMKEILGPSGEDVWFIKAQIVSSEEELANIVKTVRKEEMKKKSAETKNGKENKPYQAQAQMLPGRSLTDTIGMGSGSARKHPGNVSRNGGKGPHPNSRY